MHQFQFDNAFIRELPGDPVSGRQPRQVYGAAYSRVEPEPVNAPRLLACSQDMAERLGLDAASVRDPGFVDVLAGNALVDGMQPFASNYGGHQFGQWAGQLGDGRAISLGEVIADDGARWELQLKGAGRTPYSRHADGRAVLRSSLREFVCSEAMHHLGIPTTRALSLVATGDQVERDMFYDGHPQQEAGAIVCRVAPSFIRFGHFELPAARGDLDLLRQLVDFCIARDFPHIGGSGEQKIADWFCQIAERTACVIAHWMRVGFVHGVMNTDNLSVLGLTIDYGPYGWIDNVDPDWTPNTTDRQQRRYRFGQQPQIAFWNLSQLARALSPLFGDTQALNDGLQHYADVFHAADRRHAADKLGLADYRDDDIGLMHDWLTLLHEAEVDMTLAFRALADFNTQSDAAGFLADPGWQSACYREIEGGDLTTRLHDWLNRYQRRLGDELATDALRCQRMNRTNPFVVPRNYLTQQAIDAAEQGDLAPLDALIRALQQPYVASDDNREFSHRRPDWARDRAGCSMLSCSS